MSIKIQRRVGPQSQSFVYGNIFVRERVGERERLKIGLDDTQDGCVQLLAHSLSGPFQLLYVLHTSRTGATLGRYESPELDTEALDQFLVTFGRFLSEDSRHDFWLRSHDDDATIVLDRHNIIYAYGPLEVFQAALLRIGARHGETLEIPDPHVHHYHSEWDKAEADVLQSFPWTIKPLRQSDMQFNDAG